MDQPESSDISDLSVVTDLIRVIFDRLDQSN